MQRTFGREGGQVDKCHCCLSHINGGRPGHMRFLACLCILESISKANWVIGVITRLQGVASCWKHGSWPAVILLIFLKVSFPCHCCNHRQPSRLLFSKIWQKPDVLGKTYDVVIKEICSMYIPLSESPNAGQCYIPPGCMFVLPGWSISIFSDYHIISL